jgi:hypothetical protein
MAEVLVIGVRIEQPTHQHVLLLRESAGDRILPIWIGDSEAQAIEMANDTEYGLSGYVQSGSLEHAQDVAKQLRTGMVHINQFNLTLFVDAQWQIS